MRRHAAIGTLAGAAACALALGACGTHGDGAASTTVDVYAAASLSEVFTSLARQYEVAHPGVEVRLTFAGSSELAAQINEGAPADVFASANEAQMEAVSSHVDGAAALFASNTLTIAVPTGNPGGVTDFASLATPGLALVMCAPQVPCGAAALKIEGSLGVTLSPKSELTNVTDVLGAVSSGEADAGLVYVTDIARAPGVEGIPFVGSEAAVTRYPIAVLTSPHSRDDARGFVDLVLGAKGRAALTGAGFGAPTGATASGAAG